MLNGRNESRSTILLIALQKIGLELPRKRSGALDSQSSTRQLQLQKKKPPHVNLSNLTIMAGYIRNEDDSNATQLSSFLPQSSGVFLAHLDPALPWLRENAVLSRDELGIIVVTSQPLEATLKHQAITIPCELPDAPSIILAGILVQFGERQLKCVEGAHRLKDPACRSVAFTLWKTDWDLDDWTGILDSTTRFVTSSFAAAG